MCDKVVKVDKEYKTPDKPKNPMGKSLTKKKSVSNHGVSRRRYNANKTVVQKKYESIKHIRSSDLDRPDFDMAAESLKK